MQLACDSLDMGFGEGSFTLSDADLDMGFGATSGSVSGIIGDDRSDISIPPSTLITTVDPVISSSDPTLDMEVGEHTLDIVDAGDVDLDMGFGEGFVYGAVALGSDTRVLSWYHVHSTTDRPCSDLRRGDRCTHHHRHGFRQRPLAHRSRHGIR